MTPDPQDGMNGALSVPGTERAPLCLHLPARDGLNGALSVICFANASSPGGGAKILCSLAKLY